MISLIWFLILLLIHLTILYRTVLVYLSIFLLRCLDDFRQKMIYEINTHRIKQKMYLQRNFLLFREFQDVFLLSIIELRYH